MVVETSRLNLSPAIGLKMTKITHLRIGGIKLWFLAIQKLIESFLTNLKGPKVDK